MLWLELSRWAVPKLLTRRFLEPAIILCLATGGRAVDRVRGQRDERVVGCVVEIQLEWPQWWERSSWTPHGESLRSQNGKNTAARSRK